MDNLCRLITSNCESMLGIHVIAKITEGRGLGFSGSVTSEHNNYLDSPLQKIIIINENVAMAPRNTEN